MKIAMPSEQGYVNQHFGRSKEFTVVELENENIVSQKKVSAEALQHNHAGLAGLMQDEGVDVVIVGGIGAYAMQALEATGLKVVSGGSGKIEDVVACFIRGELISRPQACSHHGEHHHGGHSCGH